MRGLMMVAVAQFCIPLLYPLPAAAQTWNAAERDVLQGLEACIQATVDRNEQALIACHHPDFVGWRNTMPVPRTLEFERAEIRRTVEDPTNERPIGYSILPLSVKIHGDVAIIHYYNYFYRRSDGGERSEIRVRWTDVMRKVDGRWVWIADHGGRELPPPGGSDD